MVESKIDRLNNTYSSSFEGKNSSFMSSRSKSQPKFRRGYSPENFDEVHDADADAASYPEDLDTDDIYYERSYSRKHPGRSSSATSSGRQQSKGSTNNGRIERDRKGGAPKEEDQGWNGRTVASGIP